MNNYKKIISSTLLIIGIIGVILDQIYRVSNIAGNPVLIVSLVLLLISFALFSAKEKVVLVWAKFAGWWIPLLLIAVGMYPLGHGGFLPPATDKGILSVVLWGSFFFISLILIAYKSHKLRGK